jgi:hypothetical protein
VREELGTKRQWLWRIPKIPRGNEHALIIHVDKVRRGGGGNTTLQNRRALLEYAVWSSLWLWGAYRLSVYCQGMERACSVGE